MQGGRIYQRNSSLLITRRYQELSPSPLLVPQMMHVQSYQCLYFLHFLPQPFFSIDSDVQWPEWSSRNAELGPGGETAVRSEEGRAVLMLSPSGEEFSVEFTCSLSQTPNQHHSVQGFSRDSDSSPGSQQQQQHLICQTPNDEANEVHQGRGSRRNESIRSRSCSPRITSAAQPKVTLHSDIPVLISQLLI